jgi:hypothetical protein
MNNDLRQYLPNTEYVSLKCKYATDKDGNYIQQCHLYDFKTGEVFFECKESNMWDKPEIKYGGGIYDKYNIPNHITENLIQITKDLTENESYHIGYLSIYSTRIKNLDSLGI